MNKLSKEHARRKMQNEITELIDNWIEEKNVNDSDLWEDAEIGYLHQGAGDQMATAALLVLFAISDAQKYAQEEGYFDNIDEATK